jgi:hypothetical protein
MGADAGVDGNHVDCVVELKDELYVQAVFSCLFARSTQHEHVRTCARVFLRERPTACQPARGRSPTRMHVYLPTCAWPLTDTHARLPALPATNKHTNENGFRTPALTINWHTRTCSHFCYLSSNVLGECSVIFLFLFKFCFFLTLVPNQRYALQCFLVAWFTIEYIVRWMAVRPHWTVRRPFTRHDFWMAKLK